MSLEVDAGVLTADHRPGAELRVWGKKVQQNNSPCGEVNEETFQSN